jgi:NADH-quinone oxidoreductase subunit G
VRLDHHNNVAARLKARDNPHVNQGWLCDDGRVTYKRIHDPDTQITEPHAREGDKLVPISWDRARQLLVELLGPYVGDGDGSLGLSMSAQITTEGATGFVELAEQILQVDTYAITGLPDWRGDELLRCADQNPNRAGLELVLEAYSIFDEGPEGLLKAVQGGTVRTLLMLGSDHPAQGEEWSAALAKINLIAVSSNWDASSRAAKLVLPLATYAEQDGTFVNVQGRMQRIHRALQPIKGRKPAVEMAAFIASALGSGSSWQITSWISAFHRLKKHTNLLLSVNPLSIGEHGVLLEAGEPEPAAVPAGAA